MHYLPCFGIIRKDRRFFDRDDSFARGTASESHDELTRLDANITDVNIEGSDPTLQVRAANGINWTIELAKHAQNARAGLTDAMAMPGDSISVVGHSIEHLGENRIKALRLTITDQEFDLYPELSAKS